MKKVYQTIALIVLVSAAVVTLTSGISKEMRYDGGGRDLVEELYEQAVKQNDNLKAVEDGIERFYKKRQDAEEKFNNYTYYNSRYYSDAKAKAAPVADSTTKQKATDLITKSENRLAAKLAEWKNTIAVMDANERQLRDLHALLKITVTVPMIEKYQADNLPDYSKLKEAGDELRTVIEKIKAITK